MYSISIPKKHPIFLVGRKPLLRPLNIIANARPRSLIPAGRPSLSPEYGQSRLDLMTVARNQPSLESQASELPQSWSGKCISSCTRLSELRESLDHDESGRAAEQSYCPR